MRSRWTSSVFHKPEGDGRHRDVFPLPVLSVEPLLNRGVCRDVQRRVLRKGHVVCRANQAILALNSLFSGGAFDSDPGVVNDVDALPIFQQRAISDIIAAVKKMGDPVHDNSSGALSTLRAAGSSYHDAEPGVGDVVPLAFSDLSLPSKGVVGVDLLEALDAPQRAMVDSFEDVMLQDSSVWTAISRDASHLKPYSDPCLKHRKNFLKFVQLLYERGLVHFTASQKGFVGAFSVAKKSKIVDGVPKKRQRLVLDCRQTNQLFRPSPYTQLGSLSSLCELQLSEGQQLYLSGADIQDCFYAVHIPEKMQQYFCLEGLLSASDIHSISGGVVQLSDFVDYSPCYTVLPMGFSWSFYLVQQIHQSAVCRSLGIPESKLLRDGFPAPALQEGELLSMPYCDNIHALSLDPDLSDSGKQTIADELARLGFSVHENEDASLVFETLGGEVNGGAGEIRTTRRRAWSLLQAFEFVCCHPVHPSTIQRLLGHAMFFSPLNRNGMSVFRKLYDFVERNGEARMLNTQEVRECKIFSGLIPLLNASIRRPWADDVLCSDASPDGHGLCSQRLNPDVTNSMGRWNERWRYKRLEPEHWLPRQRALGLDPFSDINTVRGWDYDDYDDQYIVENDDFPEVPSSIMAGDRWKTVLMGKWDNTSEHITIKEGRALVLCLKRLCRSVGNRDKRHLILVDNLGLALCISKGRAKNFGMLRIAQQVSALSLVGSFSVRLRWVPSEYNPADGPSRGQVKPGPYKQEWSECEADHFKEQQQQDPSSQLLEGCGASPYEGTCDASQAECSDEETKCKGVDRQDEHWEDGGSPTPPCHQDSRERGVGHWPQGSDEQVDCSRDEVSVSGSEESIPALPSEIREFLQGPRLAVAARGSVRCSTRRLPRPLFSGGAVSCGRRKSGRSRGVHEHWASRKTCSLQKGSQGVETRDAGRQPVAASSAPSSRDGDEAHGSRTPAHGSEAHGRLRHLCASWRVHRAQGARCRPACSRWRTSVPMVCNRDQRPGGPQSRQDGCLRQLNTLQQCSPRVLGGAAMGPIDDSQEPSQQSVSIHCRPVPQKVCGSRGLIGSSRTASLPNSTWGCIRGPQSKRKRCDDRQGPGQMDDRSELEKIWKSRKDSAAASQVVTKRSGVLSVVERKHGSSTERAEGSTQSMTGFGWTDVFSLKSPPRRFCLEIFSGTARVTQSLLDVGVASFPLDICLFPSHNVLDIHVEHRIIHWLQSHRILFLWLGMPCTSFSRARKWDGLGPGPLRDPYNLWGYEWLCDSDKRKVNQGNSLLRFTLRCMTVCEQLGIPYALENPLSSYAWMMPPMKKFCQRFQPAEAVLDFCQFGEPWQKPTKILGNFWPLQQLSKRCQPQGGLCSMSHQPHVHLSGTDDAGNFLTLKAQPYPWALAANVARLVAGAIP